MNGLPASHVAQKETAITFEIPGVGGTFEGAINGAKDSIAGTWTQSGVPQKRRMDTLLIKHVIENTGAKAHQVGARVHIDTMCGNNDGAIFASPTTHPGKLLDAI